MNKDLKKSNQKINTLHKQFQEYGASAQKWLRKCVLLLPEIERKKVWKKKGFSCIYEYASKLAGMSQNQVDEALWVLRKVDEMPALKRVIESKGLNSVRPVMSFVNPENESFWAEKAEKMSHHSLRAYVKEFRTCKVRDVPNSEPVNLQNQKIFDTDGTSEGKSGKVTIVMQLDKEVAEELKKYDDLNQLMKELLALKKAKLESQKPAIKQDASRHIPNPIQKFISERSQGKCEYPLCHKPSEIMHHADRFAIYHIHDPDRIFDLCKSHENLCHQGLIANEEQPIAFWKIKEKEDTSHAKYRIDKVVQQYRLIKLL